MIFSKLMLPRPTDLKSQYRFGLWKSTWPPKTPASVARFQATSFMCTWKMRSRNFRMNFDVIDALVAEVRRVVVESKRGMIFDRLQARSALAMSNAISVGWTSRANSTPQLSELIEDRLASLREILVAVLDLVRQDWRKTVDEVPDAGCR